MNDLVSIRMSAALAQKMIGPWYLLKKKESDEVREAFRAAAEEQ